MFGRATIRLGIGPHSIFYYLKCADWSDPVTNVLQGALHSQIQYNTVRFVNVLSKACLPHRTITDKSKGKEPLECGPMPNVMAALLNIGGAGALCESSVIPFLVRHRKVWLTPAAGVPCSNAANIG